MARKTGVFKRDGEAVNTWGNNYAKIPKSVFAVVCWHLAMRLHGEEANYLGAADVFLEEWRALNGAGVVPQEPPKQNAFDFMAERQ